MNLRKYFAGYLLFFVLGTINADITAELAKKDRRNAIRVEWQWPYFVLFLEDGCLIADVWSDESDTVSIVAYQIHDDVIKLIVRRKTWDFAYRSFNMYSTRDRVEQLSVDVHNYYLVELMYINDKLEIYCNQVIDINTHGFIFNEAAIGSNVNNVPHEGYLTYGDGFRLAEGMKTEILSLTDERTNQNRRNTAEIGVYDYRYYVSINDRKLWVNGYFLDFSDRIKLK
jgi:hypothetical protein